MFRLLSYFLARLIRVGTLEVTDAGGGRHRYGNGARPSAHIRFNTGAAERAVALNPSLKLGECFMDGEIDILDGTIYDVLEVVAINSTDPGWGTVWMKAIETARLLWRRAAQHNDLARSRRNVRHHYDLSADFYSLFLDPDRQYSCAYFEHPEMGLDEAQLAKKRHVAAKLVMDRPNLSVLDIGCGWGGLGLYLAAHADARVTGVTLSTEQQAIAVQRAAAAGLSRCADFKLLDYRRAEGPFDRIVSVGMFEHVGKDFYDEFFGQAARLLDRDGVMLLHTIGHYQPPRNTNSFIAKYIFPGGYLPTLSEMTPAIERADLIVTDVEILRLHYADTLRHWRQRFLARRDEAKAIYDERFCRMWEFYLAGSEASFRFWDLNVFQFQIARRHGAVPITRDYIAEAERQLRLREAGLDLRGTACQAAE
ncbi:cyclopropane-fatty-acyl-phospholipid synthase [Aureimonas endophytica]|uniref:Cyclopropane-fatty-acyl-phospholipid synthase n=1 Tax=Aureimonas endophytica TaxID=2027858 RepID=A0A916ZB21_9HYPH|nr:cyclopropane-fatty-acyl-phospholipid synthase family protein [Aureimonas endophytica]GGD85538.1 cyclopropane-fatty-acyl-phospholipid synthase [Aureimonas endophytica]